MALYTKETGSRISKMAKEDSSIKTGLFMRGDSSAIYIMVMGTCSFMTGTARRSKGNLFGGCSPEKE